VVRTLGGAETERALELAGALNEAKTAYKDAEDAYNAAVLRERAADMAFGVAEQRFRELGGVVSEN
jgi:hypothetical protein